MDGAASAWPEEEGDYLLGGTPARSSRRRATARDPVLVPATRVVTLAEGRDRKEVDLVLESQRTRWIWHHALDPIGKAPPYLQVRSKSGTKSRGIGRLAGRDGVFIIPVEPGEHAIEAYVSGFNIEQVKVEVAEDQIVDRAIELTPFKR